MVDEIGGFAGQFGSVTRGCGECDLDAFLANFLGDSFNAAGYQTGGIARGEIGFASLFDEVRQPGKEAYPRRTIAAEAGGGSGVASGAARRGKNEQRVAVTISRYVDQIVQVSAGVALPP